METHKQKGVRRAGDDAKTPKTRKKRRRSQRQKSRKGSEDITEEAPNGAMKVRYELSELPIGCRRYFPPEVWRLRAELSIASSSTHVTEGRTSSSSHSSIENDQPRVKQATLAPTSCSCTEKLTCSRACDGICSQTTTETSDWSRRVVRGNVRAAKDTCSSTVRWKLSGDDKVVEHYKAERRKRYEEDFQMRKLSLTMKKAEEQTLAAKGSKQ